MMLLLLFIHHRIKRISSFKDKIIFSNIFLLILLFATYTLIAPSASTSASASTSILVDAIQLDIHLPLTVNDTCCLYNVVMGANQQLNHDRSYSNKTSSLCEEIQFDPTVEDYTIPHITLFLSEFDLLLQRYQHQQHQQFDQQQQHFNKTKLNELIHVIHEKTCQQMIINHQYEQQHHHHHHHHHHQYQKHPPSYVNVPIEQPILSSPYIMYQIQNTNPLQQLSNAIVNASQSFTVQNQPIPAWIYNIQNETLKLKKIDYIHKYGSPNVYDEFDPHVTCGYNGCYEKKNQHEYEKMERHRWKIVNDSPWQSCSGQINEIRIGLVGDHGTVVGDPIATFPFKDCFTDNDANPMITSINDDIAASS